AFVSHLDASGGGLLYSTYLGSFGQDEGTGVATDRGGNFFVTGRTDQLVNASPVYFQAGAFVAAFSAGGSSRYVTVFSRADGASFNEGYAVAVDDHGSAFATGQRALADGTQQAFVAKIGPGGEVDYQF